MERKVGELKESLQRELEAYRYQGVKLTLEGEECEIKDIVEACTISEESPYMREYIDNVNGIIEQINFQKITEW